MKIIFKQPIEDKLCDAIHEAMAEDKAISYIELNYNEWKEFGLFRHRLGYYRPHGTRFCIYLGVEIRPDKDAKDQLAQDMINSIG
jgi:hypothetical protein